MDFAGAYQPDYIAFLLKGFLVTLEVAAIAIVLSYALGILIALLRFAKVPVLSQVLMLWVEGIRNLPLLLIIFFMYFGVPEFGPDMTPFQAAVAALVVFESALISEIVRSGLNSIEKGQMEAARSSGLTYIQALRYIIVPQALRRMIPPTVSQFISLLKDTSLAVIIALPDLLNNATIVYNQNVNYVFPVLLMAALMYFAVNYPLSLLARRLERKMAV